MTESVIDHAGPVSDHANSVIDHYALSGALSPSMTDTVSADADPVSADGGTVSAYAGSVSADAGHLSDLKPQRSVRQDQSRDAGARRRERCRHGCVLPRIVGVRKWLDALKRTATERQTRLSVMCASDGRITSDLGSDVEVPAF
jgi:hypothetical protein